MRILLSNDDGVLAPGLLALHEALAPLGECVVVAPEFEQSATSHAFTLTRPMRLRCLREGWHAVDGRPADAVYMGLHHVCTELPDLVVSGINRGANLATDVLYSGTVAAAMEGVMGGVPALAVSLFLDRSRPSRAPLWESAVPFVRKVAADILKNGLPPGIMLNLNVPDRPLAEILGLRVAPLGRRRYATRVLERLDPWGRPYYWMGGDSITFEDVPGADGSAAIAGWATLTPMHVDWTEHGFMADLRGRIGCLDANDPAVSSSVR